MTDKKGQQSTERRKQREGKTEIEAGHESKHRGKDTRVGIGGRVGRSQRHRAMGKTEGSTHEAMTVLTGYNRQTLHARTDPGNV